MKKAKVLSWPALVLSLSFLGFFQDAQVSCSDAFKPLFSSTNKNITQTLSPEYDRVIRFAGQHWYVKDGQRLPPRANNWSDSEDSVYIDKDGKLHLKIRYENGIWYSAQVNAVEASTFGMHRFTVETPLHNLDSNVVLGLFLYADDENEIDIEFVSHTPINNNNAVYVVQPYSVPGNRETFRLDWEGPSTHEIDWQPEFVAFRSLEGYLMDTGDVLHEWRYNQPSVPSDAQNLHIQMNLWLLDPTQQENEVEIVITDLESPHSSKC